MDKKQVGTHKAQSMIELAMSFTTLMFMLAGTVDLGRAMFAFVAIRDAAQEGAVYASLAPEDTDGIKLHVEKSSSDPFNIPDLTDLTITITLIGDDYCAGNGINVAVYFELDMMMPLISAILPGNKLPITASITNSILRPPC